MPRRLSLPLLGVVLATALVLWPALSGDYVDDDLDLVQTSPAFFGIDRLFDAMRAPFWGTELSYWRPLTSALMCVGHWLGGGVPLATHAFALTAHTIATAAAFALLRRLGASERNAALGSAFFALHPCQVEGVAWVAALGDPLSGAFALLTLLAWLAWRRRDSGGAPWRAWALFALALASKESGIGALGLVAALEIAGAAGERRASTIWRGAIGFVAVVVAWFALRVLVFGDWGAGFDRGRIEVADSAAGAARVGVDLWLGFARVACGWYGATPYRTLSAGGDLARTAAAFAVLVPLALAFASARRRAADVADFAALAFVLALLPAALAPQSLGSWPLVDRYVHPAVVALGVLFAATATVRPWLLFALVAVCAVGSRAVVVEWRDQETVVRRALRDAPEHPEPHHMAGNLARERAERVGSTNPGELARLARAAARHYERTLALLQDSNWYAMANLRSVVGFNAALGLAWARSTGGLASPQEVAADLERLARDHADSSQVWLMLGVARVQGGDARGAEKAWQKALEVDPTSYQAAFNLGRLYAQVGNPTAARAMLEHSLRIQPANQAALELLRSLPGR